MHEVIKIVMVCAVLCLVFIMGAIAGWQADKEIITAERIKEVIGEEHICIHQSEYQEYISLKGARPWMQ